MPRPAAEAGNQGFPILAGYILEKNKGERKFAMTAPVTQSAEPVKLEMTAPVTQSAVPGGFLVQFVLPKGVTVASAPEPLDARVTLRDIAPARAAVFRYSGSWSDTNYDKHLVILQAASMLPALSQSATPCIPGTTLRSPHGSYGAMKSGSLEDEIRQATHRPGGARSRRTSQRLRQYGRTLPAPVAAPRPAEVTPAGPDAGMAVARPGFGVGRARIGEPVFQEPSSSINKAIEATRFWSARRRWMVSAAASSRATIAPTSSRHVASDCSRRWGSLRPRRT